MLITKPYSEDMEISGDRTLQTGVTGLRLIRVSGKLTIPSGIFVGALKVKAPTIIIEPDATVFASITADNVENYGKIIGNVKVADTFYNYMIVEGDVEAKRVSLSEGSYVLGSIEADIVEHSLRFLVAGKITAREIIEKEIPFKEAK
ncbi:MAG: polymer-forming cytoskeletal protein [Candidatus Paceibacterota bacterium]|jgi:cytoskeletal protein CcmA (bactofilin family)